MPELLRQCVQQAVLPAHVYRYILDFLTSQPTPEQIAAFRPTPEMQERLSTLLAKNQSGNITAIGQQGSYDVKSQVNGEFTTLSFKEDD